METSSAATASMPVSGLCGPSARHATPSTAAATAPNTIPTAGKAVSVPRPILLWRTGIGVTVANANALASDRIIAVDQ